MTFNYCYPVGEEVMDDWAEVRGVGRDGKGGGGGGFITM